MSDLVLRGEIVEDDCEGLRRKLQRTENELARTKELLDAAERQIATTQRVLRLLKKQLEPQYRSLQALFGELEVAGVGDEGTNAGQPIPVERFAAWKNRLSPACGKVIDALLVQPMSHSQLIGYCKAHYETIRVALNTLKSNALIEQVEGKKWRLKA